MTIEIDVRERRESHGLQASLFAFGSSPALPVPTATTEPNYSEMELADNAETSDFDMPTIAVVTGIVALKLSMLGLLLVSL